MRRAGVALLVCQFLLLVWQCGGDAKFFDAVPKELRCNGCELTIKILDRILSRQNTGSIEFRVEEAVDHACDEKRFAISGYKASSMVEVCNFIKKKHRPELVRELVKHYSQPKRSTYLEFAQHMCLHVLRLCAGVSHKWQADEGETFLHFDSDTHGFTVVPGHNVKLPKPVKQEL